MSRYALDVARSTPSSVSMAQGKTTTIRMLLGMIQPSAGAASLLGKPVHADARDLWAQVGYLVETPHAYPELTVRENLEVVSPSARAP